PRKGNGRGVPSGFKNCGSENHSVSTCEVWCRYGCAACALAAQDFGTTWLASVTSRVISLGVHPQCASSRTNRTIASRVCASSCVGSSSVALRGRRRFDARGLTCVSDSVTGRLGRSYVRGLSAELWAPQRRTRRRRVAFSRRPDWLPPH